MLEILNFTKIYNGGKKAVDTISFTVNNGELVGFIGHNGAGKTTTLKAIAGILNFEQGRILIDEIEIQTKPVQAKKITAFLPDNPDLYEFMSGIEFLNFIADIYKIEAEKRKTGIQKYADAFELTGALGSPIAGYSHGMKQKLALISAFIREPKLLILDEPFVGLDPLATFKTKEFLQEICSRGGAVLFSTHILEVAEKICDKIIIIKDGKLVASGKTSEIVGNSSLESVFLELEGSTHFVGEKNE